MLAPRPIPETQYDALARVTKVIPPDGSSSSNNLSTTYEGNCSTVTDQAGKKRKTCDDALGRTTQVWEPDASGSLVYETTQQYDVLGNLTRVDQKGGSSDPAQWRTRTFTYNSLSLKTAENTPEGGSESYSYDNDSRLITKTDARSITTTHSYDAIHRLTQRSYSDGTPTATLTYDVTSVDGLTIQNPVGRLVKAATTNTRTVNSYDTMGRITTQWQCTPFNCGTGWWTLTYSYNFLGGRTSYGNGTGWVTFTQSFNGAAKVTQLTSSWNDSQHPGTLASAISYGPAGTSAQMTFGNGLAETDTHNNRLQATQIRAYNPGTGVDTLKLDYGFVDGAGKNNGNVISWSATGTQTFNRSYTYDELNRVKTMSAPGEACSGLSWTYDVWANRTHQTVTGGTCSQSQLTINSLNRIADAGYGYDAAGNLTAEPGRTYQYDAENRLVSINSGAIGSYVFDANGRRVRTVANGQTTEFVYDLDGNVVSEWNGAVWIRGNVYLHGQLLAVYWNSTTYFVHRDHLASTRVLTRVDKSVQESYDYYPYGESYSPGSSTTHKFTGKERDAESGLDYYQYRMLSPLQGRWISADPVMASCQNPQSLNRYPYVVNSPTNLIDPTGQFHTFPLPFTACAPFPFNVDVSLDDIPLPTLCPGRGRRQPTRRELCSLGVLGPFCGGLGVFFREDFPPISPRLIECAQRAINLFMQCARIVGIACAVRVAIGAAVCLFSGPGFPACITGVAAGSVAQCGIGILVCGVGAVGEFTRCASTFPPTRAGAILRENR